MPFTAITFCLLFFTVSRTNCRSVLKSTIDKETNSTCCILAKSNIDGSRANLGRKFFTELIQDNDSHKNVNEENMCSLIHFLLQQATLNRKSVEFSRGMFVLYDSTRKLWDRLMSAKNAQKQGSNKYRSGYLNRFKYSLWDNVKSTQKQKTSTDSSALPFIYVRGDESSHFKERDSSSKNREQNYPAYGMDVKKGCMPNGFGHILFGKLKDLFNDPKESYYGDRLYLKPETHGIQKPDDYFAHSLSYLKYKSRNSRCKSQEYHNASMCSNKGMFRENVNTTIIEKWNQILSTIPSLSEDERQRMVEHASKDGIHEIYRQSDVFSKNYTAVKDFRRELIDNYGHDVLSRKGNEIIFTTEQLMKSKPTCDNTTESLNLPLQQCSTVMH